MASQQPPVGQDTLISVKIAIQGSNKKFKVPLSDMGPHTLPAKLRSLLDVPHDQTVIFERFSDSSAAYITLDPANLHVWKSLFRAAKAKTKLRLRATIPGEPRPAVTPMAQMPIANGSGLPNSRPNSFASFGLPNITQTMPMLTPLALSSETTLYNNNGGVPIVESNWRHSARSDLRKDSAYDPVRDADMVAEDGEAPVPRSFSARENLFSELSNISRAQDLALRMKNTKNIPMPIAACSWSVYCNNCDKPMANEHYHCSICDDGDYDLCGTCVDGGVHCPGDGHWLVKRFVNNGKVINSTTEKVKPKLLAVPELPKEMPGAFTEEKKVEFEEPELPTRTCNACVKVFPESDFVTCTSCDDYDLCKPCHYLAKHGHHPAHAFKSAIKDATLSHLAASLCAPGRHVRHSAICDGCDKFIYGVRYKCLNCPDWDFCSACHLNARIIHPRHRFVPIYEPLADNHFMSVRHYGIYCDGPLCQSRNNQSYIEGVRYKCAICHDTDFCANCEAHPTNKHNRTHPLIKFKTPVRNVSVTTMGEDKHGSSMATMGDQQRSRCPAFASASANAATQVQTIVDVKPTEARSPSKSGKEKIEIKDLLAEPIEEKAKVQDVMMPVQQAVKIEEPKVEIYEAPEASSSPNMKAEIDLNAHFLRDTITDGTKMLPSSRFLQIWTLRNPGPNAWPAGCSVRYVGGDNMLDLESAHPSSASDMADATESNVIGRPVEVGEEIAFRVMMKAPKRECTSISYWRLKTPEGTPFGHRLWCHIETTGNVALAAHPPTSDPLPPFAARGEDSQHPQTSMQQEFLKRQAEITKMVAEIKKRVKREQEAMDMRLKEPAQQIVTTESVKAESAPQVPVAQSESVSVKSDEAPVKEEFKLQGSAMIFPTLEKESPSSSTHQDAIEAEPAPTVAASQASTSDETEIFEDAESVDLLDSDSDEGFLTDEEYDILDASDEELL